MVWKKSKLTWLQEVERIRENRRKRGAAIHQAKLDRKKARREYVQSGKPNLGPEVIALLNTAPSPRRKDSLLRKIVRRMGSAYADFIGGEMRRKEMFTKSRSVDEKKAMG